MRAAVYDRYGPAARGAARDRDRAAAARARARCACACASRASTRPTGGCAAARRAARRRSPTWCRTRTAPARSTPSARASRTRSSADRVWVYFAAHNRQHGAAAQWVCLPERQAVPLPDGASFDLGASLGIPALTAHRCLFADGPLDGRTVLVAGGAGAVGHFAIELGRRAGARIIATVSSDEKAALARAAGADAVVNYRSEDAAAAIRAAAPDGVDRVDRGRPGGQRRARRRGARAARRRLRLRGRRRPDDAGAAADGAQRQPAVRPHLRRLRAPTCAPRSPT